MEREQLNERKQQAETLGRAAFDRGIKCAPALDVNVRYPGCTAKDVVVIADAWLKGWWAGYNLDQVEGGR